MRWAARTRMAFIRDRLAVVGVLNRRAIGRDAPMVFVTQSMAVISDAVRALQSGERLKPVAVNADKIAEGRVLRVRNLKDGPRGERRTEITTDDL